MLLRTEGMFMELLKEQIKAKSTDPIRKANFVRHQIGT